jgi:capsular polysaccharide biosynthesis protein
LDLRRYLQVSARRWWLVLLAVLVTGGATAKLVLPIPDEYQSKATFIVRPNGTEAGEEIRAIDTLIRGGSINATYASIARSRLIRDRAREHISAGSGVSGLRAKAEVVTGTNILSITVRSRDPQLAHAFLAAVSEETVAYVLEVDDAYRLEPLDPPSVPTQPVDARKGLTISLGVVLGLALGVGLSLLIEYLRSPYATRERDEATPIDPDAPLVMDGGRHAPIAEAGEEPAGEEESGEEDGDGEHVGNGVAAARAVPRLEVVGSHPTERVRRAIRDVSASTR